MKNVNIIGGNRDIFPKSTESAVQDKVLKHFCLFVGTFPNPSGAISISVRTDILSDVKQKQRQLEICFHSDNLKCRVETRSWVGIKETILGVHSFLPFMTVLFVLISLSECFYVKPICVNSGDTEYTCKTFRDTPVTYKRQYIKLTGVNDKSDISRQHGLP